MPDGSSAYSLCVTLVDAKVEKRIKDAGLCVCDSFYLRMSTGQCAKETC